MKKNINRREFISSASVAGAGLATGLPAIGGDQKDNLKSTTAVGMQLICEGHAQIKSMSHGMRIVLNRPEITEKPVLQGESNADATGASIYGSVIRDGGIYRMWYQAWPGDWNLNDVITVGCVESDDGLNWRRPEYGLVDCMGSKANQLTDLPFHAPSVFIDPMATSSRRYRAFGYTAPGKVIGGFKLKVNDSGYFTAFSSDGLHWTLESPDPLWKPADVITSAWDPVSQTARIALKNNRFMGGMTRRAFSTAEWSNGKKTDPVSAFFPDEYDDIIARAKGFNSADYYGVGLMPTEGPTIGFLWNFRHQMPLGFNESVGNHGRQGSVEITIVYQLERGGIWRHVSGRPDWLSAHNGPDWIGGAIYTASYPIDAGDETWLYFCSTTDRHGWAGDRINSTEWRKNIHASKGFARIGRASWKRNRIIGCRSEFVERINITAQKSQQSRLVLNAVTRPEGLIRVQLMGTNGKPLPGYEYENCEPMKGDSLNFHVRWKGKDSLPPMPANAEIEITKGTLYAFEFTLT